MPSYLAGPVHENTGFTRRKQKSLNDTEDTGRDNSIWFLDLKRGVTSLFKQRKWQDDFEVEPTGVFSPETATNLRFSPINCLFRHSWWFGSGFTKYLTEFVRYGSSTANSQLKTKLKIISGGNGNEYSENGNIINSELKLNKKKTQSEYLTILKIIVPLAVEHRVVATFANMRPYQSELLVPHIQRLCVVRSNVFY